MATPSSPLRIIPLYEYKKEHTDEQTLQRILTRSTNPDLKLVDAEVETLLLRSSTGARRVLIKGSGAVHVSLQLLNCDDADNLDHQCDSLLCWTSFDAQPDIMLLVVLTSPTLVSIFDIYGQDSIAGGEGHQIFLPFQARSVFSLPTGGFLIQRLDSPEDAALSDDDFFLHDHPTMGNSPITSLFSIEDALDPALPVTTSENLFFDVKEKVLWVGDATWLSNNARRTICVSYHVQLKRHTIWSIEAAPSPPSTRPLWELSANSRVEVVPDTALLEGRDDPMYSPYVTRNEALADALGVARRIRPIVAQDGAEIPANPLHPSICLHPAYQAMREEFEAEKIFLATSLDGKSPILCLFGNHELTLYSLSIDDDESIIIGRIANWSCLAAAAIKILPLPSMCSTDIIVVTMDGQLELLCGHLSLAYCSFMHEQRVLSVTQSVGNQFDLVTGNGTVFRASIECWFASSTLSERALLVIESALFSVDCHEHGRRIRIDCLRIAANTDLSDGDGWLIVSKVLARLLATNIADTSRLQKSPPERNDDSSHWEQLLNSDFHRQNSHAALFVDIDNNDLATITGNELDQLVLKLVQLPTKPNPSIAKIVFDSMHILYEESKLHKSMDWQRSLGVFLISICVAVQRGQVMSKFIQHYKNDLGSTFSSALLPNSMFLFEPSPCPTDITTFDKPPCLFTSIEQLIIHGLSKVRVDVFFGDKSVDTFTSDTFATLRVVRGAFAALFNTTEDYQKRLLHVVKILVKEGYHDVSSLIDRFPVGILIPLIEALLNCRQAPDLLIKDEVSLQTATWQLIGREDLKHQVSRTSVEEMGFNSISGQGLCNSLIIDEDNDGIGTMEFRSQMIFRHDNRLHEVGRLLRSSRPTFLKVQRAVEVSDHDFERMKQNRLLLLCQRVQALPLGRGMYTLGSLRPIPAEPLQVPMLCLSGRVPPNNATLVLDTEALSCPKHMTVWPEFHNGVAAGLRLPLAVSGTGSAPMVSRAWIVANRNVGRIAQQQRNQQNNQSNNEFTEAEKQPTHAHGGLLMALGLRGHLSALSMTDIYEYLTQGSVTTSVGILLGMSASRRSSCDPAVSKMLCLHIPSLLPASFSSIDVSGPAHAAAVTGIGLLYQGSSHRLMTEFLLSEMGRRPTQDANTTDRDAYALSCGLALGLVNLACGDATENLGGGNAGLADLDIELRLNRYIVGGNNSREVRHRHDAHDGHISIGSEGERCSRIHEGCNINNDVTAPGATLALGLMYLKSGNKAVASSLALPDTHFLLEYVRPDFLLLRVIARTLILWDDVEPSIDWINQQIPAVIRDTFSRMNDSAVKESGMNIEPAVGFAEKLTTTDNVTTLEPDIDMNAVRQIHVFVRAGACFGMGLRFAGTGHKLAADAIVTVILALTSLRDGSNRVTQALRPESPILEMCLGLCAISLSLIMAGTGDLGTLRHLKLLRWKCNEDIKYGNHMSYNAALGLLFLGGGEQTIGRDNEDIAALIIAFFPRFPVDTSDNHYHLQALRHFYALAAQEKVVQAIDIDTGSIVPVAVQVHFKNSDASKTIDAPCLLMNSSETVSRMSVQSDLYYPSHVDIDNDARNGTTIFVKRRILSLTHANPTERLPSLISTRSVDVLAGKPALASQLMILKVRNLSAGKQHSTNSTKEAIQVHSELTRCLELNSLWPRSLWGLRLIKAYYENKRQCESVLNHRELAKLIEEFEAKLNETQQQCPCGSLLSWFGYAPSMDASLDSSCITLSD